MSVASLIMRPWREEGGGPDDGRLRSCPTRASRRGGGKGRGGHAGTGKSTRRVPPSGGRRNRKHNSLSVQAVAFGRGNGGPGGDRTSTLTSDDTTTCMARPQQSRANPGHSSALADSTDSAYEHKCAPPQQNPDRVVFHHPIMPTMRARQPPGLEVAVRSLPCQRSEACMLALMTPSVLAETLGSSLRMKTDAKTSPSSSGGSQIVSVSSAGAPKAQWARG